MTDESDVADGARPTPPAAPTVVRWGPDGPNDPGAPLDAVVDDPSAGGTYVLVFEFATTDPVAVDVGALGVAEVPDGTYAYAGSAFGPGGFSRVERHRRHLDGDERTVHWHVDALTTRPEASFVAALLAPRAAVECAVAGRLPPGPIDGFGSSDCACRSHLSTIDPERAERHLTAAVDAGRPD